MSLLLFCSFSLFIKPFSFALQTFVCMLQDKKLSLPAPFISGSATRDSVNICKETPPPPTVAVDSFFLWNKWRQRPKNLLPCEVGKESKKENEWDQLIIVSLHFSSVTRDNRSERLFLMERYGQWSGFGFSRWKWTEILVVAVANRKKRKKKTKAMIKWVLI